jgi:hypothetical protein
MYVYKHIYVNIQPHNVAKKSRLSQRFDATFEKAYQYLTVYRGMERNDKFVKTRSVESRATVLLKTALSHDLPSVCTVIVVDSCKDDLCFRYDCILPISVSTMIA